MPTLFSSQLTREVLSETACLPLEPDAQTTRCGLVQSTVTVTAKQIVQPSVDDFNREVTEVLRLAIDTGSLGQFLPADCQLQ